MEGELAYQYQFDLSSLAKIGNGGGISGDGSNSKGDDDYDCHSSFTSGDGSNVGPDNDNELSHLLIDNDWEEALSMISSYEAEKFNIMTNEKQDRGMMQPLHYACREGAPVDIIDALLKLHPEVMAAARVKENGWIPLHYAAAGKRDSSSMKRMCHDYHSIEDDDESDVKSLNITHHVTRPCRSDCLLCKDTMNRIKTIDLLLKSSPASTQTIDYDGGLTPLHVACLEEAEDEVLKILLDSDPTVAGLRDDDGNLPLHWVFHKQVSRELVERLLHAYPRGAESINTNGQLALHKACTVGAPVDVIRLLLSQYPDGAKMQDENGNLPLHLIVPKRPSDSIVGGVDLAMERDQDIKSRSSSLEELLKIYPQGVQVRNKYGETALHRALSEEVPLGIVQLLIDASPDCCNDVLNQSSGDGSTDDGKIESNQDSTTAVITGLTPLHVACRYNAPVEVIQILLKANPQQARQFASEDGTSRGAHLPIHAACRTAGNDSTIDTVDALLTAYPEGAAIPDESDKRLPLHLECMARCHPDVIQMLLNANEAGAEGIDCRGRTALHYAGECNEAKRMEDVVKILLDTTPGAQHIMDNDGCVPCLRLALTKPDDELHQEKEIGPKLDITPAKNSNKRVVRFA